MTISLIKSCTKHQDLECTLKWQLKNLKKKASCSNKKCMNVLFTRKSWWSADRNLAKSLRIRICIVSTCRDQRRKQLLKECLRCPCWDFLLQLACMQTLLLVIVGLQTGPCIQRARRDWKKRRTILDIVGRFNEQGNLQRRLVFGSSRRVDLRSHLLARMLKVYIEP